MRRAVVLGALALFIAVAVVHSYRHAWPDPPDFGVRYAAAIAVRDGKDPYDAQGLAEIRHAAVGRSQIPYPRISVFRDPPIVAHLFLPFTALPYRQAAYLWLAVLHVVAFAVARVSLHLVGWATRSAEGWLATWAFALGFAPLRYGVSMLQLDPVNALLALAALWFVLRRRHLLAGTFAGFALLKPQATAFPIGATYLARLRALPPAIAVGVALVALPALIGSSATWSRWWETLVGHPHPLWFNVLGGLVVVTSGFASSRLMQWKRLDPLFAFAVGACVNGVLFALFYLNPFSTVLLIVPVMLIARWVSTNSPGPTVQLLIAVDLGLLLVSGMSPTTFHGGARAAVIPIGSLVLLVVAWTADRGVPPRFVLAGALISAVFVLAQLDSRAGEVQAMVASALTLVLVAMVQGLNSRNVQKHRDAAGRGAGYG